MMIDWKNAKLNEEFRKIWLDYVKTLEGKKYKEKIENQANEAENFLKKMDKSIQKIINNK